MIDGMGLDSDSRGAKVGKTGPMIFDDLDVSTTRSPRLPARLKRLPRRCQPEAMISGIGNPKSHYSQWHFQSA